MKSTFECVCGTKLGAGGSGAECYKCFAHYVKDPKTKRGWRKVRVGPHTEAQREAREINFMIYRLKSMLANCESIFAGRFCPKEIKTYLVIVGRLILTIIDTIKKERRKK